MNPEKVISVIEMYQERLTRENVPKIRMDPKKTFASLNKNEILAHAHFITDGAKECARQGKLRKMGSHLTVVQMCLSFAGWHTLEELMNHNRLDPEEKIEKMFEFLQRMIDYYGSQLSCSNNDPGGHYQEAQEAYMKLCGVKSFKSCLENVVDLDEKKVFNLLGELEEKFKDEEQSEPEGLSLQERGEWRQEMLDKKYIMWVLEEIRGNLIHIMQDNNPI